MEKRYIKQLRMACKGNLQSLLMNDIFKKYASIWNWIRASV